VPRIAVVQRAPALLNRESTVSIALDSINEAAKGGAQMIVFPEAFVPGYPTWIWRLRPGGDMKLANEIHARLLANAVDLSTDHLAPIKEAARTHRVWIICGIDERESDTGTVYNTLVFIGPDGSVANRHRKLMPTNPERMVWGFGDASGLRTVQTSCGRTGALICWENYMPLARYALYSQGIELYLAPTWDCGEGWIGTLQHIAREGRCWVAGSGTALNADDIPEDFPERARLFPDPNESINAGDSVVIDPAGAIVAGPLRNEKGILYADIDPTRVAVAKRSLDVVGHYARPDIFTLHVNRQESKPTVFLEGCDK
jgi:nitrilase